MDDKTPSFTHDFPFDPTYGMSVDAMQTLAAPPAPDGFADFWRGAFARSLAVPPRVARRTIREEGGAIVEEIEFDALGLNGAASARLGGWLITPRDGAPRRVLVEGHGYGGREAPMVPAGRFEHAILQPCLRGFHRSIQPDLPRNEAERHVVHGIASRETYVHLGNAADVWATVGVARELFGGLPVDYAGTSFGGGIGALATPWDDRLRRVALDVPSFGNHPVRLRCPCIGSGEAVRRLHASGVDVLATLRYFDAATAASFTDKPTLVACAAFDPAVPPPGQFSVYNAIRCEKRLFVRAAGHFACREAVRDDRAWAAARDAWLNG